MEIQEIEKRAYETDSESKLLTSSGITNFKHFVSVNISQIIFGYISFMVILLVPIIIFFSGLANNWEIDENSLYMFIIYIPVIIVAICFTISYFDALKKT